MLNDRASRLVGRRGLLGTAAAAMALAPAPVGAQSPIIRIGVLNDMSGPYRDTGGPTAVACVRQALEDFGVSAKRMNVEVLSADHQNKADIGAGITREWFDKEVSI